MYKKTSILLFLLHLIVHWEIFAQTFTPMNINNASSITLPINQEITENGTIYNFTNRERVISLSLDGHIIQTDNNSLIRIVLEDTLGNEYLVAESNRMINDLDTITLENYCEETFVLQSITLRSLKFYLTNAKLFLSNINIRTLDLNAQFVYSVEDASSQSLMQVKAKAAKINEYNRKNKKLWIAAATDLALKSYSERKVILGITNDTANTCGFEFYADGIFEIKDPALPTNYAISKDTTSLYVPEFDWRNRHGKNWMTPNRNQGKSGLCVAFSLVATTEALVNLFYNKKIDLDLSEADIAVYGSGKTYHDVYNYGMQLKAPLWYGVEEGICDEYSLPFIDDPKHLYPSMRIRTDELVKYSGYHLCTGFYDVATKEFDEIKRHLISKGPMHASFKGPWADMPGHSMALVGYKTLSAGDTVAIFETDKSSAVITIEEGDERIGCTVWTYKDSYGDKGGYSRNGYSHILYVSNFLMNTPYYLDPPFTTKSYSFSDIVCEDADGDGYYYWGIGTRSPDYEEWIPLEPDGDDSDYNVGPMNQYGYCQSNNPNLKEKIILANDTLWNTYQYIHNHIVVENDVTLTISNSTDFYAGVKITLTDGAKLIVDNATLNNVTIDAQSGSIIELDNGATIYTNNGFFVPKGVILALINGKIL